MNGPFRTKPPSQLIDLLLANSGKLQPKALSITLAAARARRRGWLITGRQFAVLHDAKRQLDHDTAARGLR